MNFIPNSFMEKVQDGTTEIYDDYYSQRKFQLVRYAMYDKQVYTKRKCPKGKGFRQRAFIMFEKTHK